LRPWLKYNDEEYESLLQFDAEWSKAETDYLFDLLARFDLRFMVVHDRWQYDDKAADGADGADGAAGGAGAEGGKADGGKGAGAEGKGEGAEGAEVGLNKLNPVDP
jgi:hypothetical protein